MRSLLVVVLLIVGTWAAPFGTASAADLNCTDSTKGSGNCDDEGQAVHFARLAATDRRDAVYPSYQVCGPTYDPPGATTTVVRFKVASTCSVGGVYTPSRTFPNGKDCASRSLQTGWLVPDPATNPEQKVCYQGCTYKAYEDTDGSSYFATLNEAGNDDLGMCGPGDLPYAEDDADGDGTPDASDAFPNDPNEDKDSDGDGIGDNADFAPNDPTDGKDTPGEADGDDEGDNQASGGGDCRAPPTCSGDGIACAQLYQQWKIACSLGGAVSGDPTNCNSGYTCAGDPVQCAQVALMRKAACGIAGLGTGGTGNAPGDANGNGQPDWTEGAAPADADPGDADADTRFGLGLGPSMLDQENIFGEGTCPAFSISIMGVEASSADIPAWCDIVAIMRAVILIMGAFTAIGILTGRV